MRRWFSLFALLLIVAVRSRAADAAPVPAEPTIPPLLLAALTKLSQDFDRWAYTETRNSTDRKGKPRGETIVRFDPSKPYEEQFTPVKVNGHEPTEKERADYRKRGVKRGEQLTKDETEGKTPAGEFGRFKLNDGTAAIDLARATVESETATTTTYNVPLRRDAKTTLPVEKIELIARLNKERQALENVSLRLKDSFRMKLVVNVKAGAGSIDFTVVDPKHVPVMSAASGEGTVSVMFVKFGGAFDVKRTEFQRVKPYSERFGVKIGPMKALDF
jgi:hypothetical protein